MSATPLRPPAAAADSSCPASNAVGIIENVWTDGVVCFVALKARQQLVTVRVQRVCGHTAVSSACCWYRARGRWLGPARLGRHAGRVAGKGRHPLSLSFPDHDTELPSQSGYRYFTLFTSAPRRPLPLLCYRAHGSACVSLTLRGRLYAAAGG